MPIILPTNALSGKGLGYNMYEKAALGFLALKDMLGDEVFGNSLKGFMNQWQGKHPMPWDLFYSFNTLSGKNLNWFWQRWYFSMGHIDLGIENVEIVGNNATISLRNTGGLPAPVDIVLSMADGTTITYHQTSEIWEKDAKTAVIQLKDVGTISKISLDGGIFIDAAPGDNIWQK